MNDFTKEELKFIYDWLNWISKEDYPVKNKIQSMIDNYCEHESSEPILVLNKKCIKCNCHLETRPWGPE
jgi:hypothetical protein